MTTTGTAQFQRLQELGRATVRFTLDGRLCTALAGDTVLTALLTNGPQLRRTEFSDAPRAGFCLMGACQDCWVMMADGRRVRACTTLVQPDMELLTGATP